MAFDKPIEQAVRWDIYIQQGSTFERAMEFVGADLTGLSFRGQIRRSHSDGTVLGNLQFDVLPPSTVVANMSALSTAQLPQGTWVFDVEAFTFGDAYVARVLEGRARVSPEVTR